MKRIGVLVAAICVPVLLHASFIANVSAQTPTVHPSAVWPERCAGPTGEYSRGAALFNEGFSYVCANVRNGEWQRLGVTWVRVESLGNALVLTYRGPSVPGNCVVHGKGEYSRGAALNLTGESARCAPVFDRNFSPAGVAWVDATLLYDDFFVARIP